MTPPDQTGAELIAAERCRQQTSEGCTLSHDDTHTQCELLGAAINYVDFARFGIQFGRTDGVTFYRGLPPMLESWPRDWPHEQFKPNPDDPIRDLVKAGALIAAEIDRLQRKASR